MRVQKVGVLVFFLLVPLGVVGVLPLRRRGEVTWILLAPFIIVARDGALTTYGNLRFREPAEICGRGARRGGHRRAVAAPVSRRFAVALGAIVAAGIAVRVAHTLLVAPWPPGFFNDEAYYKAVAELVARGAGFVRPGEFFGQGISIPTAERPPLYSLALAGLVKLRLGGPDGMRLLGAVSGGAVIALLGLLGRRLAGDRAGLIAAGLAAAYPTLIAADGALMTESLYGMFAAAALLLVQGQLRDRTCGCAALLGAVGGLAALTRGEGLILLPVLLLPLLRDGAGPPGGAGRGGGVRARAGAVDDPQLERLRPSRAGGDRERPDDRRGQLRGHLPRATHGHWQVSCVRLTGDRNEAVDNNQARDGRGSSTRATTRCACRWWPGRARDPHLGAVLAGPGAGGRARSG